MILPIAFLIGAFIGWRRATARDGSRADKWQYAVAHGIAVVLLALVATILLDRAELV